MPFTARALCAALFLCLSQMSPAHAQNSAYVLANMPTAAEIEAAFPLNGADPVDAAARRAAAFKLAGVVLARSDGRNGAPSNLTANEFKIYQAYSDAGPSGVRAAMGWPAVFCGNDKDCARYDELVLDYVWRDKKKAEAFGHEFRTRLFTGKETMLPDRIRYSKAERDESMTAALATLIAGVVAGLLAAAPWARAREGAIKSIGSGFVKANHGLISLTYNSRNHLTVGEKKLGTTITSPRVDDALGDALNLGAPVRIGVGRSFWRAWALSVRGPTETVREPVFAFFLQVFLVAPLVGALAIAGGALLGVLTGSGHVSVFTMALAASYTVALMLRNLLAWRS